MPLTSYATSSDLADWTGVAAPANADALLRSASVLIARACFRDPYSDNPTGDDQAALRDAACAQAAGWVALGINPDAAGLDTAPVKTTKIGTGSVERDTTGQTQARQAAATELAPTTVAILQSAGLLTGLLPAGDNDSRLPTYGMFRPFLGAPDIDGDWPFGSMADAMTADAADINGWDGW